MSDTKALKQPVGGSAQKIDFYETPPEATRALLSVEPPLGPVWEPCAGYGAIAEVILSDTGFAVLASTLETVPPERLRCHPEFFKDETDFLEQSMRWAPTIITNPPYKRMPGGGPPLWERIVRYALGPLEVDKLCLLLPFQFWCGQARAEGLYREHPVSRIHCFADRITLFPGDMPQEEREKHSTATMNYAWFIWERHARPGTVPTLGHLVAKDFRKES